MPRGWGLPFDFSSFSLSLFLFFSFAFFSFFTNDPSLCFLDLECSMYEGDHYPASIHHFHWLFFGGHEHEHALTPDALAAHCLTHEKQSTQHP